MRLHEESLPEQGGKVFALEIRLWCFFFRWRYQVELEGTLGRANLLGKAQALGVLG